MSKTNILNSFLEPPKDINSDLHPLKPWVLTAVDNGESNMVTVAIYDYKNKRTIVSLGVNTTLPQPVAPFASVGSHHTIYPSKAKPTTDPTLPGILMATVDEESSTTPSNNSNTEQSTARKSHIRNTISFGTKLADTPDKPNQIWCGADTFATDYGLSAADLIGIKCPQNAAQIPTNTFIYPSNASNNTKNSPQNTGKATELALIKGAPFLPTPGSLDLTSGVYRSTSSDSSDSSSNQSGTNVQKACGNLRVMKFYDSFVRSYKSVIETQKDLRSLGTETKLNNEMRFDCCGNYGVLVFDYRVVFLDYVTLKTREIPYSDIKSFQISSLEIFSKYRFIAFGCTDGNIRLFDTERWAFFKVLSGGHKQNSTIVKLFSLVHNNVTWLLSLGTDGAIAVWDVDKGTLEKTFPDAHEGGVSDVTFDSSNGRIFTYGNDKNIVEWGYSDDSAEDEGNDDVNEEEAEEENGEEEEEVKRKKDRKKKKETPKKKKVESIDTGRAPFREVSRNPINAGKVNVMGFSFIAHPDFAPGSFICFKPDTAEVFIADSTFTTAQKVFSVADVKIVSPVALKRPLRIYSLSVHPLQRNVIVVVSSRGSFLIKIPYNK